jgi:DNA-binding beta-propeller fold protein YncE
VTKLGAACILAMVLTALAACGEKITIPQAVGIPTSALYLEVKQEQLVDPTAILEAAGKLFVLEGTAGTLTKYNSELVLDKGPVSGLIQPVCVALDSVSRTIIVGEAGDGAGQGPRLSMFDQADLGFLHAIDLTGQVLSIGGLASTPDYLYLSDPDSGAVHRFAWTTGSGGQVIAQGEVSHSRGSIESPQFVQRPMGLAIDSGGKLLICDADTTRNWVIRFDPLPPIDDDFGTGTIEPFRSTSCATADLQVQVLGKAPGCGEVFEGGPSGEAGELFLPRDVAMDRVGSIYVADRENGRGQRFSASGEFEMIFGDGAGGAPALGLPSSLATWHGRTSRGGTTIEIPGARIYVIDVDNNQVRVFEDKRWSDLQGDN